MHLIEEYEKIQTLKLNNPEAYELFTERENTVNEYVKRGCHDIRNYITFISGSFQLMEIYNPELKELSHWRQMETDIDNLTEVMNQISEFRYSGKSSPIPISFEDFMWCFQDNLTSDKEFAGSQYEYCITPGLPNINIDPDKITLALKKIIKNAIEIPSITPVIISADYDEHNINIIITNDGTCVPNEVRESLFDPFCTTKSNHLGLGLSTCATIIHSHNGTINYISENDQTRFVITLPIR